MRTNSQENVKILKERTLKQALILISMLFSVRASSKRHKEEKNAGGGKRIPDPLPGVEAGC